MNLVSSVIMHPADECIVMYAIYTEPDCKGVPMTFAMSFETEEALNEALNSNWFDSNGSRK